MPNGGHNWKHGYIPLTPAAVASKNHKGPPPPKLPHSNGPAHRGSSSHGAFPGWSGNETADGKFSVSGKASRWQVHARGTERGGPAWEGKSKTEARGWVEARYEGTGARSAEDKARADVRAHPTGSSDIKRPLAQARADALRAGASKSDRPKKSTKYKLERTLPDGTVKTWTDAMTPIEASRIASHMLVDNAVTNKAEAQRVGKTLESHPVGKHLPAPGGYKLRLVSLAAAHEHVLDLAGVCTGPGPCDTKSFGTGNNWVNRAGGLPAYIKAVAHALQRQGKSESTAIATAVATVKRWAAGGGDVSAATRARAAAAVAEWEAKKAKAHSLSATSEGLDLAPKGQPPNQTKTKKKAKADPNANKAALDAQQAQFLNQTNQGGDFNSKHPRAGAGSATGGQFITAGSGGDSASSDETQQIMGVEREIGVEADGVFSPQDAAALVAWQKKQGLQADGVVGAQTASRMSDGPDKGPGALGTADRAFLSKRGSAAGRRPSDGKARRNGTATDTTTTRSLSATGRTVDLAARTDLLRRAAVAHRAGRLSAKQQQMVKTYLNRIRNSKG